MSMSSAILLGSVLVSSILARTIEARAPGFLAGVHTLPARIQFDGGEAGALGRTPIKFAEEEEGETRKSEGSWPKVGPIIEIRAAGSLAGVQTLPSLIQFDGGKAAGTGGRTPIRFADEEETEGRNPQKASRPIFQPRLEVRAPGAKAGAQTLPARIQFGGK